MAICKDCIHYKICDPYVAPNESFPEVKGGCKCFENKGDFVKVERKNNTEINQIEEMALCMKQNRPNLYFFSSDGEKLARRLYDLGYRKQSEGEWIKDSLVTEAAICSLCGYTDYRFNYNLNEWGSNYCPNCGAKMDIAKNATTTERRDTYDL